MIEQLLPSEYEAASLSRGGFSVSLVLLCVLRNCDSVDRAQPFPMHL